MYIQEERYYVSNMRRYRRLRTMGYRMMDGGVLACS